MLTTLKGIFLNSFFFFIHKQLHVSFITFEVYAHWLLKSKLKFYILQHSSANLVH